MNDRIERVLAALTAARDPLEVRAIVEDLYDTAQDDLLGQLHDAERAADAWQVSRRRANAHITHIHRQHGVGTRIGGALLLRQSEIEKYRPRASAGRPPKERNKTMLAVEIKLDGGTFYLALNTFDNGKVLVPMSGGERVLSPADIRANWNAWVSDEIADDDLLTADELTAQHPDIPIDHE